MKRSDLNIAKNLHLFTQVNVREIEKILDVASEITEGLQDSSQRVQNT